jgi:hypothetical protein
VAARVDQGGDLLLRATPSGQGDGALWREVAARGVDDRFRLRDKRLRLAEVTEKQLHAEALDERDREQGERAGLAREPHLSIGQFVPGHVVAQRPRDAARKPEPAQRVLLGHRFVAERTQRALQSRRSGGVPLGGQHGHALE